MKKTLIDYMRDESCCHYSDIYDYFKDLNQCDNELKVKYLTELIMYIYQQEQIEESIL